MLKYPKDGAGGKTSLRKAKEDYSDNRLSDEQEDKIWKSVFDKIKKFGIENLHQEIKK